MSETVPLPPPITGSLLEIPTEPPVLERQAAQEKKPRKKSEKRKREKVETTVAEQVDKIKKRKGKKAVLDPESETLVEKRIQRRHGTHGKLVAAVGAEAAYIRKGEDKLRLFQKYCPFLKNISIWFQAQYGTIFEATLEGKKTYIVCFSAPKSFGHTTAIDLLCTKGSQRLMMKYLRGASKILEQVEKIPSDGRRFIFCAHSAASLALIQAARSLPKHPDYHFCLFSPLASVEETRRGVRSTVAKEPFGNEITTFEHCMRPFSSNLVEFKEEISSYGKNVSSIRHFMKE